jgi:hypothetical protein
MSGSNDLVGMFKSSAWVFGHAHVLRVVCRWTGCIVKRARDCESMKNLRDHHMPPGRMCAAVRGSVT